MRGSCPVARYQLIGIDADGVDGIALEVAPDRRVVLFIDTPRDWWRQYLLGSADERAEAADELWVETVVQEDVARSLAPGCL